jgi:phosphatidylglycerol:prolipoprotein diacylglycerol transferase
MLMLPRPYYTSFMLLSLAVFAITRMLIPRSSDLARLPWKTRTALAFAGFIGGAFGAKLPFMNLGDDWLAGIWFRDGKTVTTGLVGAYLGVELAKIALNIRVKTGDSFAIPLALALTVGRWGCFFNGCCFGLATTLPCGCDFGDGILRHPTQIYESFFHLGFAIILAHITRWGILRDQRLKLYLIAYCVYRFVTEWIRPEPAGLVGLTTYQIVVTIFAMVLIGQWIWDSRRHRREPRAIAMPIRAPNDWHFRETE